MNNLLNETDSHNLFNEAQQNMQLCHALDIAQKTGAKLGLDGDSYYYGFGELPEPTGVYGYGKTPTSALMAFSCAFYSQTVKSKSK